MIQVEGCVWNTKKLYPHKVFLNPIEISSVDECLRNCEGATIKSVVFMTGGRTYYCTNSPQWIADAWSEEMSRLR